jgi:hypothetical protein
MQFTEQELATVKQVARRHANRQKTKAVESFLSLWIVEHYTTVQRYRLDEHGQKKLYIALRNAYYNKQMKNKLSQQREYFNLEQKEVAHEENRKLRKKIGEDILQGKDTETTRYINKHKQREALISFFTEAGTLVQIAKKFGIHQQALYRAKRNTLMVERDEYSELPEYLDDWNY